MPHYPKPFFKASRGVWYVQISGKQINLGKDKDEAFRLYHELMANPEPKLQTNLNPSVTELIDLYLDWVQKHRAPDTYEWYQYRLQRFVDRYPDIKVNSLKPFHVEQWVDQYKFAETTRRNYFRSIKTCLTWALKQGHIDRHPLEALQMPGSERKDVYLPPEEFQELLGYIESEELKDLFITTYHTGARPQETLILTGEYVDLGNSRWVFPQKKSKGKHAPRIVYLDDTALEITKRLLKQYPSGNLFRNTVEVPWNSESVNCAVDRIRIRMGRARLDASGKQPSELAIREKIKSLKKTTKRRGKLRQKTKPELREEAKRKLYQSMAKEMAPRYSLYALRHSWATNALKQGVDPLTVALLMGHKDPSMLARVYQHLSHSPEHMREQARRAATKRTKIE